jgi:hypothetical protein
MDNVIKTSRKQETAVSAKDIPVITQKTVRGAGKPAGIKIARFHGALYRAVPVKPLVKNGKPDPAAEKPGINTGFSLAKPAHHNERLVIAAEKTKHYVEKHTPEPAQPAPEMERIIPVADRLVAHARKAVLRTDKKAEKLDFHARNPVEKPNPPGCARRSGDQSWWK